METLPDCGVAWAIIEPAEEDPFASVQIASDALVLVYGKVDGVNQGTGATACLQAWRSGGAREVRRLHGVFAWMIVDRNTRKVYLSGDSLANLGLYYAFTGKSLVASPHDLSVLATGAVPFELDPAQLHATLCRQWSPGGKSLLRSVERVPPDAVLCSGDGGLRPEMHSHVLGGQRLSTTNTRGIKQNVDRIVEIFQEAVLAGIQDADSVDVTLSAGIDSRVVFSAALATRDISRLRAISSGSPETTDVQTARQVATLAGVGFHNSRFAPVNIEQFASNAKLFAFAMNGDLCEAGSLFQIVPERSGANTVLFGSGGEMYRGASRVTAPYRHLSAGPPLLKGPEAAEEIIMQAVDPSLDLLLNGDPQRIELARSRVLESLCSLSRVSSNYYDLLDLYYMYEKAGVWGKSKARQTWRTYKVPFASSRVSELAWTMPVPIGVHCPLHVEFLRRHWPEVLRIPINGKVLLAPANESLPYRILSTWTRAKGRLSSLRKKAVRTLGGERGHSRHKLTTDMGVRYRRLLQVDLQEYVDSMVCDANSVARKLLERQSVSRIVAGTDVKWIVALIILENWKQLATEIQSHSAWD